MKKLFSILAIAAVATLAFVSCSKDDKDDKGNVKGTYSLDYDVDEDTDLSDRELSHLEVILDDMVEDVVFENVTLNEVVEEVKAMIKEEGPRLAARYPEKYFTVEFEIYNDKDECVKTILAKCKNGKLL